MLRKKRLNFQNLSWIWKIFLEDNNKINSYMVEKLKIKWLLKAKKVSFLKYIYISLNKHLGVVV